MYFRKKKLSRSKKSGRKLEKNLGGIKDMKKTPDAIFVVDPKKEKNLCSGSSYTWNSA